MNAEWRCSAPTLWVSAVLLLRSVAFPSLSTYLNNIRGFQYSKQRLESGHEKALLCFAFIYSFKRPPVDSLISIAWLVFFFFSAPYCCLFSQLLRDQHIPAPHPMICYKPTQKKKQKTLLLIILCCLQRSTEHQWQIALEMLITYKSNTNCFLFTTLICSKDWRQLEVCGRGCCHDQAEMNGY